MRTSEPSERDFEIFCDVEFDGLSLRKAAERYGISASRVQQVVAEMRDWYRATTPQWVEACPPHLRPLVACRIAEERLGFLYGKSLDAWEDSRGNIPIQRQNSMGVPITVITRSAGQPRYLLAAARLSMLQVAAAERLARIAGKTLATPAVPPIPRVPEVPEVPQVPAIEAAAEETPQETLVAPPEIGCALAEPVSEETAPAEADAVELTAEEDTDCDVVDLVLAARTSAVSEPMRAALTRRESRKERRKAAREKRRKSR